MHDVLCLLEVRPQGLGDDGCMRGQASGPTCISGDGIGKRKWWSTSQAPSGRSPFRGHRSVIVTVALIVGSLARPAEIFKKKTEKVQLRAVSVDFAICQKFGAANFHVLDRPTVIRKATSQTTLSALEPAPSPASKSRRRRVGDSHRLATDAHVAPSSRTRLGNGTGRRERLVPYCGPARLLGPLRLGPTSHLKSSIHFYFCSLQFSQPQPS